MLDIDESSPLLSLDFDDRKLRVAGEELKGHVCLNFKKLQKHELEEVTLGLMGAIFTYVSPPLRSWRFYKRNVRHRAIMVRWEGQNDAERTQQFNVFQKIVPLWKKGAAYPQPDEHVLKIPFSVTLPADLPPSYKHSQAPGIGVVEYVVQVVGTREKKVVKKIQRPIPVLPVYPEGVRLREQLRLGWTGEWKGYEFSNKIRKGLWGDYATVSAMVSAKGSSDF